MTVYKTAREEILKDWQANLQDFASEHEFPVEATESLQDALEIIGEDDRLYAIFRTWEENYWKDPAMDYQTLWATLEALDGTDGISKYTLELLFIIGISRASAWRSSTIPWRICTGNFWSATKCMASGAPL